MSFVDMGMFADGYEPNAEVRVAKLVSQRLKENYGIDYPWQYVYAQNRHETGGFDNVDSELAQKHHNYAGIKVTNPMYQQAVEGGTPEDDGTAYRHFDDDTGFADYQARNLLAYMPYGLFDAKTPKEAAQALYDGGYYTTSPEYPTAEQAIANYGEDMDALVREAPIPKFSLPNIYGYGG